MSQNELLIHEQGISVYRKHINILSTELYKSFQGKILIL